MLRRIIASGSGVAAIALWFVGGTFQAWFFGGVLGMMEVPSFWRTLVEWAPPILFASLTVWLLLPRRPRIEEAEPNMRLEDVVLRAIRKQQLPASTDTESVEVLRVCETLREKALLGTVTVFGGLNWRTTRPQDYDDMVRDRIRDDYWRDHRIDVIGFLGPDDRRGRTSPLSGAGTARDDYYGLWFDRRQIDAIWPAPWPKIDWRHPINWKTT